MINTWIGGVRLDHWNATWPFARLGLSDETLTLKVVFREELTFAKPDIDYLEVYQGSVPVIGRVTNGVGIIHQKPGYPKRIIFGILGT